MHAYSNQDGGEQRSKYGKGRHRDLFFCQQFKIQEERTGKQEKPQHAVQNQALEIDLPRQPDRPAVDTRRVGTHADEAQGAGHREQHGADGDGQTQPAGTDPAKDCSNRRQETEDLEGGHGWTGATEPSLPDPVAQAWFDQQSALG